VHAGGPYSRGPASDVNSTIDKGHSPLAILRVPQVKPDHAGVQVLGVPGNPGRTSKNKIFRELMALHSFCHKFRSDGGIVHQVRDMNDLQIIFQLGDTQVKSLCCVECMPNIQFENFEVVCICDPNCDESEA
jgi:hypothetical protein